MIGCVDDAGGRSRSNSSDAKKRIVAATTTGVIRHTITSKLPSYGKLTARQYIDFATE